MALRLRKEEEKMFGLSRRGGREGALQEMTFRPRSQSWLTRTMKAWRRHNKPMNTLLSVSIVTTCWILFLLCFPFSLLFCIKIAKEYERAVVFRIGRLKKGGTKGPGSFLILPCIETYRIMDLRVISFDVPTQEVLSQDLVTVYVDAVIYCHILNPITAVTTVNDPVFSTQLLAQTSLRNVLGMRTLSEILAGREAVATAIQFILDQGTMPWGIKVDRMEIKDIRLPKTLMKTMASEAVAARDARARLVAAKGEERASRVLLEASEILCENVYAIQLRNIQNLLNMSSEKKSTIVFPILTELPNWLDFVSEEEKRAELDKTEMPEWLTETTDFEWL